MPQQRAIVPDKGLRPIQNNTGTAIGKGLFVQIDPAGSDDPNDVVLPGAGEEVYGVNITSSVRLGVSPDAGLPDLEIGTAQVEGRAVVIAGALVAIGANIQSNGVGRGITATTGDIVVGKAITGAAADGDEFECELVGAAQSFIST